MKKKKYDLIFSIGAACSCTRSLRFSHLQNYSYPFDWLFGSSFKGRVEILISDFKRYIEKSDLEDIHITNNDKSNLCEVYYNKYNDITFNHDFPANLPFEKAYEIVRNKYDRRISRLLSKINTSKSILIVYIETPDCTNKLDDNNILFEALENLKNKYPDKTINILYFYQNSSMNHKEFIEEIKTNEITKVVGNYKGIWENAPSYEVDGDFFKNYLKQFRLNMPVSYKIKRTVTKILINLIPIKNIRKNLRIKNHF